MKILLALLSFLTLYGYEDNNHKLYYEGYLHYENETIRAKTVPVEGVVANTIVNTILPSKDEYQNLATFYSILHYEYISDESMIGVNFEARYNTTLFQDTYTIPIYLNNFGLEDINTAFIAMASVDVNSEYLSMSVGRNLVDMPHLQGSIDGVMLYNENDYLALRGFWLYNYYDFQINYFSQFEKINNEWGMYGLYLDADEYLSYLEISLYYYLASANRDYKGVDIRIGEALALNFSYASSSSLGDSDYLLNELFIRAFLEYSYENHYVELGASKTGDNALIALIQLGTHPFSEFYLNNEINRAKAQNVYLKYGIETTHVYMDIIAGATSYEDDVIENRSIVKDTLYAKEIDVYLGAMYNNNLGVELGYMYKKVDERDLQGFDQSLVMATLLVGWQ